MFRNKLFFLLALVCLLAALTPLSDFDFDGNLDSLVTEGFVLLPWGSAITGIFYLWVKLPVACPAILQQFSFLILPPPIDN